MIARRRLRNERRGLASLEFTLAFPIMLLFASAVLMVGRAGLARTSAAISARKHSWEERVNAQPPDALSVLWDVGAGAQKAVVDRSYKGWVGAGGSNPVATSRHTVFAGAWDFRTVKFEPNRGIFTPHFSVMGKIAANGNSGIGQGVESTVGAFTRPLGELLTNQYLLGAADTANYAVKAAGYFLKYTLLPFLGGVETALDVLEAINPFSDAWDNELDSVNVFQNAVKNLWEASKERPGTWLPDKLKKITKALKL